MITINPAQIIADCRVLIFLLYSSTPRYKKNLYCTHVILNSLVATSDLLLSFLDVRIMHVHIFHFEYIDCSVKYHHRAHIASIITSARVLIFYIMTGNSLFVSVPRRPWRVSVILIFPPTVSAVSTERDGCNDAPLSRERVDFRKFARWWHIYIYIRVIKRRHARTRPRWADVGLQQQRELTLTRISLRRVLAPSVSSNARRVQQPHVTTRACTRGEEEGGTDVLFAPKHKPGPRRRLTACRYVSQPCCILPPISSLTSFWVALEILPRPL